MSQLPQYTIAEDQLTSVQNALEEEGLQAACVKPKHVVQANKTMYREWRIRNPAGRKVIMWDEHTLNRASDDKTVFVTLGSPDGRKGRGLLNKVESVLVRFGASKRV